MFDIKTWPRDPWSIFDELDSLQRDMNRALAGRGGEPFERSGRAWRHRPTYPLMNVWSGEAGLIIDVELPGVNPEDVDVAVMGDELTLRGKVNAIDAAEGETYHRRERPSGEFERTLTLPFRAKTDGVKANYKNGVLRLTIPRSEEEKPRKIQIES